MLLKQIQAFLLKLIWQVLSFQPSVSLNSFLALEYHSPKPSFSTHFQKNRLECLSGPLLSIGLDPEHLYPCCSQLLFFKFPFQNLEPSNVYHLPQHYNYQALDSIISSSTNISLKLSTLGLTAHIKLRNFLVQGFNSILPYFIFYQIPLPKLVTSNDYSLFNYIGLDQVIEQSLI